MQRNSVRARLALLSASIITLASSGVALAQTFAVSMGVRETQWTDPVVIGGNGGPGVTGQPNSSIEFINRDGLTLVADGTWQTFTFNFGADPVAFFAGTQPTGGAANALDGTNGTFESIRFRNSSGITSPVALYIDDVYNTPAGGSSVLVEDFESYPAVATPTNGAPEVMFRDPRFSGSNQGVLTTEDTGNVSADSAASGSNSYRLGFTFFNGTTTNYLRLTTFNTPTGPTRRSFTRPVARSASNCARSSVVSPLAGSWTATEIGPMPPTGPAPFRMAPARSRASATSRRSRHPARSRLTRRSPPTRSS